MTDKEGYSLYLSVKDIAFIMGCMCFAYKNLRTQPDKDRYAKVFKKLGYYLPKTEIKQEGK